MEKKIDVLSREAITLKKLPHAMVAVKDEAAKYGFLR